MQTRSLDGLIVIPGTFIIQKTFICIFIAVILVPRKFISCAALFWLVLLMFVILLEKKQYKYLIPFIPALTGWATVMVATPVAFSFRYVYFLFLLQPVFVYLLVTGLRQDHSNG